MVAIGSVANILSPSLVSRTRKFSSQSRSLGFNISQDNHSSLCCKLNVEKLNIRSVPASGGRHGKSRSFTSFLNSVATTDDDEDYDNDDDAFDDAYDDINKLRISNIAQRVMCDISQYSARMVHTGYVHMLKSTAAKTQGQLESLFPGLVDQFEIFYGETSREDLMYLFVVEMLADKGIVMVPDLYHIMKPSTRIDLFWVSWFKAMHSREAFEMMLSFAHERGHQFATTTMGDDPTTKIIKLRDLYTDSVVYGYYLHNVEGKYRRACAGASNKDIH